MARMSYANESIHAVITKAGTPTVVFVPDDPKNFMAGGKNKLAIGNRTFEDDQDLQSWLAVFLYKNGNTFDVDTIHTVAFTLASLARETAMSQSG